MTKKTKVFFIVLLSLLPLCLIAGFIIRSTYTGYTAFEDMEKAEPLAEYGIFTEEAERGNAFEWEAKDFDEMMKKTDVVVKVSATNDKELYPGDATKTKVTVQKVWKGDLEEGDSIYVYEPGCFAYLFETYYAIGGYQIMQTGKEYLLFLRKLQAAKGYHFSEKEKKTFLPCTAGYSKFPLESGEMKRLDVQKLDDGEYKYKDIQNLEIITSEQSVLDKYEDFKKKAYEKYGEAK